jgi:hypothetical protein
VRYALIVFLLAACEGDGLNGVADADLAFCVDVINNYRTMAGKPPLGRASDLERYAAEGASADGMSRVPHQHFRAGDAGVAAAENEFPFQSLRGWGTLEALIAGTTAQIWTENETSEPRRNLVGPYREVGCGLYTNGDEVTLVEDFR